MAQSSTMARSITPGVGGDLQAEAIEQRQHPPRRCGRVVADEHTFVHTLEQGRGDQLLPGDVQSTRRDPERRAAAGLA